MRARIDDVARAEAFDAHLGTCEPDVQRVVGYLRDTAANASLAVGPPTFEVRGVGVTYWAAGRWFCRFDPKREHVWIHFRDADRMVLAEIGTVAERTDGVWLTIGHMTEAVRVVPEILRAHDAALGAVNQGPAGEDA